MNLPEISVKNPVTTLMTFLGALMVGIMCLFLLPVDSMPEMDIPSISVITPYDGAAPEEVETKVTEVLERFLSTVPELKHIMSTSAEDRSMITLMFEWGTNLDARSNEVRDAVGNAKMMLPDEIDEPRVVKFNISSFPIMVYGVMAKESYPRLEKILEDEIADPLKRLPGVGSASVNVPLRRQINVDVDRERLASFGLKPQDVVRAIINENRNTSAGNIKMGLTDYLVRIPGEFEDVKLMEQIVLAVNNGSIVRLSDVGTVEDGFKEIQRYVRVNGESGGVFFVQKQSEANTVQVARAVRKRVAELVKRLPPDVQVINVMDSAEDIERSISDLSNTLLIGGLLTMAVVLIFLRQWHATLVIGTTIPFSLLVSMIFMYFLDYTINMISLFAMIVGIGMIVDNSIVILENIFRHREKGERPREGAIYGSSEVAMAITASTLTTLCILFPILFVRGITKIIFSEFAVVISIVLISSLFSALTLTPMLSSVLIRKVGNKNQQSKFFNTTEEWFNIISEKYAGILDWALKNRKKVMVIALSIFLPVLFLVRVIGTEFIPDEDQAFLRGNIYLPVGTRVEETFRVINEIEKIVYDEVLPSERIAIFTRCGVSESGTSAFGEEAAHIGGFNIKLVPKVERNREVREIASALRRRIEQVRGQLQIEKFSLATANPMSTMISGGDKPLTIDIVGDDMEVTDAVALQVKEIALNTPGAVDITISRERGRPEIWVDVDREKASAIGLNVSDIGDTIRASFYGREASKYRILGDEYDIFVRLREADRIDVRDVQATPIRLPQGQLVRVDNIAQTNVGLGPVKIERKDRARIVKVEGNAYGRSIGQVVADIENKIKGMQIPHGVEIYFAGQAEEQRESFFWLLIALAVGSVLVYMVMASQFESLLDPFVVMFSVPFGFTGAILAVFLGGHNISIVVFLGMLLLIGIVVNNAIVLVDYTNILRARGLPLNEAVRKAGQDRLRPVLMTAVTTIFGLMPMAFKSGQGSEVWNPMGLTIMGGLIVSTFVTLVLVPTMYSIFERHVKKQSV
ncbi:MAG: efflux RND transporter permease subunit [Phycisphaerae bacterium]